jgi:hypothetical protein
MDPEIEILTATASVTAAPAIIPGNILIARDRGSNQNPTTVIAIVRRTGRGLNFDHGVTGRSTGIIAPAGSTAGLTIPW